MNYRAAIQQIKTEYMVGAITFDEAKAKVLPLLDEMNEKGAAIAKKAGFRYKKLGFSYVFR